jgi:Undecaprenyl-phosphate glucose phosphotransferase
MSLRADPELLRVEAAERVSAGRSFPLPTSWIAPLVFVVEFVAIVAISVITGVLYEEIALGHAETVGSLVAVGVATYVDFAIVQACGGAYSLSRLMSEWRQAREVTLVWILVCLFLTGIAFLLKIGTDFSRGATILFFLFGLLFLISSRLYLARYLISARERGAIAEQRTIVLVGEDCADSSSRIDELKQAGYDPIRVISMGRQIDGVVEKIAKATYEDPTIGSIFLILDWQQTERVRRVIRRLSIVPLPIYLLPDGKMDEILRRPMVQIGSLWTAELQRGPLSVAERAVKRTVDVTTAALASVLLLPLGLVVALLIKLDSPGPILFVQTRAGFNNRPFRILKFRTLSTLDDGPVVRQVSRDDVRFTRIGRVLRRTSIDELPQLINVLRGEMSLVGPRPHAAAHNSQYEQLIGNYAFRHHVKPGLTGWAQVNGMRGETNVATMQRRVDLDLWYIDNWSLWLDLKIMARTAALMLRPAAY